MVWERLINGILIFLGFADSCRHLQSAAIHVQWVSENKTVWVVEENRRHVMWLRNKSRKLPKTFHESRSSSYNLLVLREAIRCNWHHFQLESNTSCKVAICSFSPSGNDHSSQEFSCHETRTKRTQTGWIVSSIWSGRFVVRDSHNSYRFHFVFELFTKV